MDLYVLYFTVHSVMCVQLNLKWFVSQSVSLTLTMHDWDIEAKESMLFDSPETLDMPYNKGLLA